MAIKRGSKVYFGQSTLKYPPASEGIRSAYYLVIQKMDISMVSSRCVRSLQGKQSIHQDPGLPARSVLVLQSVHILQILSHSRTAPVTGDLDPKLKKSPLRR
jgi:hypothetical protein